MRPVYQYYRENFTETLHYEGLFKIFLMQGGARRVHLIHPTIISTRLLNRFFLFT